MAEPLIVNLSDLRAAMERTLDSAESRLGATVALPVDYYWHLPVADAFDMTHKPDTLTAGQVSDDLGTVHDVHERVPEEAWHDLSHLIGVLRALEFLARS